MLQTRFGCLETEKSNMIHLYAAVHPDDAKNPILKHIMRKLENPKSGKVSFEHFISAVSTIRGGSLDERIGKSTDAHFRHFHFHFCAYSSAEFSFALFDIDGDGKIDKFEMLEIVRVSDSCDS